MKSAALVLVARERDIVTVTLNRPDKLNAINLPMWRELQGALRKLNSDASVRCIVLRGAERRAFSPGADIGEFEKTRATAKQAEAYGQVMHGALAALQECRHPTIAMIHGLCVGGGLEVAILCDLRICGESARFGVPISRIGVIMAYPEMAALIDLVGRATAMEILLEGRVFNAAEAREKGLVTRVVPDAEVEEETDVVAKRIADGAPLVHRWHKKFAARLRDPKKLTAREKKEGFASFDTADFREGYKAFLEKRPPKFTGK